MIYENPTNKIGIDIDDKDMVMIGYFERRMLKFTNDVVMTQTKRGFHFKMTLPKKITWWQAMFLRWKCGDDKDRMILDFFRHKAGSKYTDVLFDYKRKFKSNRRKRSK